MTCGAPATLIETISWMKGRHAVAVRQSLAAHDPTAGAPTVRTVAAAPTPMSASAHAWLDAGRKDTDTGE